MRIPLAHWLLPCLPVSGPVSTAAALHTQTAFVAGVQALGGSSVLTVKANQPTLYADLATSLADPHASYEQDRTTDPQRGRREVRSLKVSTQMNAYLTAWPPTAPLGRAQADCHRALHGQDQPARSSPCSRHFPLSSLHPSASWNWCGVIGALKIRCTTSVT